MKIHPREKLMVEAKLALGKWSEKYDLTPGEEISIFAGEIAWISKYMIRDERHGNTDTPGGLSSD